MRWYAPLACIALLATLAVSARVTPPELLLLPHTARQPTSHDLSNRVPPEFNINSGGPAIGRFVADNSAWIVGETSTFGSDDFVIGGAEPRNLPMYRSHRFGLNASTWGYDIPVMRPGIYGCTAHFAETDSASFVDGRRVFDLYFATAQGEPTVFDNIDIVDQLAGAQFTVLTKTAPELVVTGILSVRVVSRIGNPIISGLTCERTADLPSALQPDFETDPLLPIEAVADTPPSSPSPSSSSSSLVPAMPGTEVNVNCGGPALGRFVAEDHTWIRGTTSFWGGPEGVVIGGADAKNAPAIISHRYGLDASSWGYTIPVESPGIYACSLHFAETDTSSFSVGARVFDVKVMGNIISDVDVYAETGEAEFTAVVKTFTDLTVTSAIEIDLIPKVGDAFLAAITCEKTHQLPASASPQASSTPNVSSASSTADNVGPQPAASPSSMGRENIIPEEAVSPETVETETPDMVTPEVLVPESDQTVLVPTGSDATSTESPMEETPAPDESTPAAGGAPPAPTVTPTPLASPSASVPAESSTPQASVQSTPVTAEPFEPSMEPSPEASASAPAASPTSSPSQALQSPLPDSDSLEELTEEPLVNRSGEFLITYNLRVIIEQGGLMTKELRDLLKRISSDAVTGSRQWAAIGVREIDASTRQANPENQYALDMQASYSSDQDEEESRSEYTRFIDDGSMNERLEEAGANNVRVSVIDGAAAAENFNETATVSNTSTIVGVVVGCVLGAMVLVAVIAFYVLKRNRSHNEDDFNAPPPTMTESEMSSVVERTETAASIEYLDDDSTFTAATSRAGEQADQMAYVKDAFGRGTEGAHGTTAL